MTSMEEIPLFPLNAVLFPRGRLPMQIFEKRYLDLISRALRTDTGFGICLIREGGEVARTGVRQKVHRTGTYARIIDWETLPNGLLGITAEGVRKFTILECRAQDDNLLMARVSWSDEDDSEREPIPVDAQSESLVQLLQQLTNHPMIERLNLDIDYSNLREIGWRLSELLPIPASSRQALLEIEEPHVRIEEIERLVGSMTDQA